MLPRTHEIAAATAKMRMGRDGQDRARRNLDGRPEAEGQTRRRDPIVRQSGNSDCSDLRHRWRRGHGYSYTIGSGGPSIVELIARTFATALIGRDPAQIEKLWKELLFLTHATSVGAITSLALAAVDTALWDLRCIKANLPLHLLAGGAQDRVRLYTTEGGWLNLEKGALVEDALKAKENGFSGAKLKIGRPVHEDVDRLQAVRTKAGEGFEIFTDANQAFNVDEAIRRARQYEALDIGWMEEPLTADDLNGHIRLSRST